MLFNLSFELHNAQGVDIECLSRQKGTSAADCIKNAPMNTTIRLSCKPHYVPLDNYGEKIIEKTCDASGNWLPRKAFACKLGNYGKEFHFNIALMAFIKYSKKLK